jgi:hypothetical protein
MQYVDVGHERVPKPPTSSSAVRKAPGMRAALDAVDSFQIDEYSGDAA